MDAFSFDAIFDQPKPRSKDNVVDGDGGFCLMEAQWSWVDKGTAPWSSISYKGKGWNMAHLPKPP